MAGRPRKREAAGTVEELEERSYGSRLRYECGLARRFVDPETGGHYVDRWMQVGDDGGDRIMMCPQCNWNNSWTPTDSLDSCDWVQCLYPPPPPVSSHFNSQKTARLHLRNTLGCRCSGRASQSTSTTTSATPAGWRTPSSSGTRWVGTVHMGDVLAAGDD